jgi:hypothetical protein
VRSASRRRWEGPLLWSLWGALMGIGLLSILSIGFLILVAGLALLVPLVRRRASGAWMALAGASVPLAVFALQGIISPGCAGGSGVITPSGKERFTCDVVRARTELVPILLVSATAIIAGLAAFLRSRRKGGLPDSTRPGKSTPGPEGA